MFETGVFLDGPTLRGLPGEVRSAVLEAVGFGSARRSETAQEKSEAASNYEGVEDLACFSDRQVAQLLKPPLSDKGRKILEAVASGPQQYRVGDVLKKLGVTDYGDLRWALSGLTRRARKIANDRNVYLFGEVRPAEDVKDAIGQMHPETHAALRRLFGKK
jgi:hypothetical protein